MKRNLKTFMKFTAVFIAAVLALNFMVEKAPVVYLVGDSTMSNKPLRENPERGWGMVLPYFFNNNLKIENHARNGRSTKSFISEGRWQTVLDKLQAGDYVFIQFGHNDTKEYDSDRYAPANTLYKENLKKFVDETRGKEAVPVLLTPVVRRRFNEQGEFYDTHGEYPGAVKEVAKELDVELIDLHEKSRKVIVEYGEEKSKELFLWIEPGRYETLPEGKSDNTHFSIKGAYIIASLVFESINELELPLLNHAENKNGIDLLCDQNILGVVNEDDSRGDISVFEIELPKFPDTDFNIVDYGAVGDGITLNTDAINSAIKECSETGGGRVVIPRGMWLTGPIWMKNNVNLYVDNGAHVQFSEDFDLYPLIMSDWEGTKQWRCQSPINGRDLKNIAITGEGIFDGGGDAWRYVKRSKVTDSEWKKLVASGGVLSENGKEWYPSEQSKTGRTYLKKFQDPSFSMSKEDAEQIKDYFRPVLLSLIRCKNVLLDGPTFQNSPAWNLHPLECEGVIVRNITVRNPWYSQNGDGIDFEACDRSVLYNSSFDVGDDAVCIKSGRNEHGRKRGRATRNLVVKNILVYHAHGGFTIGSEMSGGANNIRVTGCNYIGTDVGIRFKSNRERGGIVENIFIDNIYMKDIPTRAISFNMFYEGMSPADAFVEDSDNNKAKAAPITDGTPTFRKIYMSDIYCDGAEDAIVLQGLPERAIAEIYLSDAILKSKRAAMILDADNISLKNVKLIAEESPLFMISQSGNIKFKHIDISGAENFMKLAGDKCENISIHCSPVTNEMIEYVSGAVEDAVEISDIKKKCQKNEKNKTGRN